MGSMSEVHAKIIEWMRSWWEACRCDQVLCMARLRVLRTNDEQLSHRNSMRAPWTLIKSTRSTSSKWSSQLWMQPMARMGTPGCRMVLLSPRAIQCRTIWRGTWNQGLLATILAQPESPGFQCLGTGGEYWLPVPTPTQTSRPCLDIRRGLQKIFVVFSNFLHCFTAWMGTFRRYILKW